MSVYTITVTLTPEEDAALQAQARRDGRAAEEILSRAALAPLVEASSPGNARAVPERNVRLGRLLDQFETGDDAQTQARDLAQMQANLEAGRSGQRRLFGEGVNP